MLQFIDKWLSTAHIVALQKLAQAGTGVITAALVVICLTPQEQGYYVTMGSLLSSYTLLDLGLSMLLVQVSARYFAGLSWGDDGAVLPLGPQRDAFLSLVRWCLRWYAWAGIATLVLIPVGWIYFNYSVANNGEVSWHLPWIAIVTAIALGMPAIGLMAIMEGAGRIRNVYILRTAHYVLGAMLAWAMFLSGKGLFAQAMAPLAIVVVIIYWMRKHLQKLLPETRQAALSFRWSRDIAPQHKRVALTWLSGYLFLHIPVPILFYFTGATEAGRMGLSMTIANVLGAIAMSSVTAVAPHYTMLVAQGRIAEATRAFRQAFVRSMVLLVVGSTFFVVAATLVHSTSFATRILSPFQLVLLFTVFGCFHSINGLAIYFRAFGKEPIATPNLLAALAQAFSGFIVIRYFGVSGLLLSMLVIYFVLVLYVINDIFKPRAC